MELLTEGFTPNKDLVAHFFCSYSHQDRLTASNIFRSYIKQIIGHLNTEGRTYPSKLGSFLRESFSAGKSPLTFDEIIDKIFIPLNALLPDTIYIIDGIDECSTAESHLVLKAFRKLLSQTRRRIFISGRASLEIRQAIPTSVVITISHQDTKEDIREFVDWKIKEKRYERQLTDNQEMLQEVKTSLIDKADRM